VNIVLGIVLPVFAIIALGYAASRWRFVDDGGFRGLNFFTFSIASPCLLFNGGTSGHEGGGPAAFAPVAAAGAGAGTGHPIHELAARTHQAI
jgi:predicted permease